MAGPRNDAARTHPDLVPWDELSPEVQDKDRDAVRGWPQLLYSVGYQVVGRRRPVEPRATGSPSGMTAPSPEQLEQLAESIHRDYRAPPSAADQRAARVGRAARIGAGRPIGPRPPTSPPSST